MANTITDSTLPNMIQSVTYSAPRATSQGAKTVNVLNSKTRKNLRLSTPLLLTYGASDYVDQSTGIGNDRFNMALAFSTDGDEDSDTFLKNMIELESKIKADALLHSKEWFGKVHKSAEVVDALWTPMLKYSKDKNTGEFDFNKKPTLRVKLPKWDGTWTFDIYDEDSKKIFPDKNNESISPMDFLTYKSNVACIIEFAGIWFINGKFSATWKLVQAMVQRPQESIHGKCFINLKGKTIKDDSNVQSVMVEDSDDEDSKLKLGEVVEKIEEEDEDDDEEEDEESELPVVQLDEEVPLQVDDVMHSKKGSVTKKIAKPKKVKAMGA
jgi:hypothetical protein